MKISEHFNLSASQGELDFVDVDPTKDLRLFLDPYAIQINALPEDDPFYTHLISFFSSLLDALRANNEPRVRMLVSNLHEPRDTFLGMSKGAPQGLGLGGQQANALVGAIRRSEAFRSGQLEDLAEAELFVPGVGADKISDLTTNVLRAPLIEYTKGVARLLDIPLQNRPAAPAWNADQERWESKYAELPVVGGQSVLLVPKALVRKRLCLDSQEYYDYYIDYLQAELEPTTSLTSALRGASGRVTKERVRERYPFDKEALAKFAVEHPDQFEDFKRAARRQSPVDDTDIDPDFVYATVATSLAGRIRSLAKGRDEAAKFERLVTQALTLLLWPKLTFPIGQRPIHEGMKKVDVEFAIYARTGFWWNMRSDSKVAARVLPVECKNYTDDVKNPEFDQLLARFSIHRGRLGVLVFRDVSNEGSLQARQRAAVIDGQGYVLTIGEQELVELLSKSRVERDIVVEAFFDRKFRDLIAFS